MSKFTWADDGRAGRDGRYPVCARSTSPSPKRAQIRKPLVLGERGIPHVLSADHRKRKPERSAISARQPETQQGESS